MIIIKLHRTQGKLTAWRPSITSRALENLGTHNAHACYPQENGRPYVWPSKEGSARCWQRSSFKEKATNFLTFVASWIRGCVFRTNRSPRGEMWLNGQTDRHTHTHTHTDRHGNYRNPRCACALRVNKIKGKTVATNVIPWANNECLCLWVLNLVRISYHYSHFFTISNGCCSCHNYGVLSGFPLTSLLLSPILQN